MTLYREATWTALAERVAPPDWRGVGLRCGILVVGAGFLGYAFYSFGGGFWIPLAVFPLRLGHRSLWVRYQETRNEAALEPIRSLREGFAGGPVWAVDLIIRQGEAPTGRDQGLMWVEDGRIVFAGLRTSFALAPEQAVDQVGHHTETAGLRLRLNLVLRRETPAGPLSLSFWPIESDDRRAEDAATSLRSAMNRLLKDPMAWQARSAQWPPVAIGPGAPTPIHLRLDVERRTVGWLIVAVVPMVILARESPFLGLLGLAFFGTIGGKMIVEGNSLRWQAYRDARAAWGGA